jgi:hypothetical protein
LMFVLDVALDISTYNCPWENTGVGKTLRRLVLFDPVTC